MLYRRIIPKLLIPLLFFGAALAQVEVEVIYIPQVGHGGGLETVFNFMNGSNMLNRVTLETYDNAGEPANLLLRRESPFEEEAAVDSLGLEVSGLGTTAAVSSNEDSNQVDVGYALIYSDWGEDFGVEVVFQQFNSQGSLTATTAIIPLPPTDAFSFVAFSNSFAKTGIALLIPPDAEEDAEVTLTLFDNTGTWLGDAVVELGPGEKIAQFLNEEGLFPDELADGEFTGSCEVRSPNPVAVTILKQSGSSSNPLLSTQTVQDPRVID